MPPKKAPITAEGIRVFLDDPIEGVRVIRSSNGIYQADRSHLSPAEAVARQTTTAKQSLLEVCIKCTYELSALILETHQQTCLISHKNWR